MNNILKRIRSFIFSGVFCWGVLCLTLSSASAILNEDIILGFNQVLEHFDKSGPVMIDTETRLDKIKIYENGRGLIYNYTLVNYTSNEAPKSVLEQDVLPKISKDACLNHDIRQVFEKNAEFKYVYSGRDNIFISEIILNKNVCNQLVSQLK